MNWEIVEGNWKQFKGTVRARWGQLTDDQLDAIAGKRVQLLGKIQEVYGINRATADREIKAFEERNKNYRPKQTTMPASTSSVVIARALPGG